ncbi:YaaC family protein [Micromonospora wenchangensis]|uniref:YaaC family protein n=1 Tax=Micromonospora wenchangensis TaxID=1185415 RepID=UPI003D7503E9
MLDDHRVVTKVDIELVWAALRSTRAEAPAGIRGGRRKTYVAALEQAQQMFTAAANVGIATRPLLLFYGLSQGGRAIAAAAKQVRNNDYPLVGHGIKVNTSTLVGPVTEVQVYGDNTTAGSFTRLSKILNSPTWEATAPVSLGELWKTLPESTAFPLERSFDRIPLPVSVDEYSVLYQAQAASPVQLVVTGIPADIMPPPQFAGPTPELEAFLVQYPKLAGHTAVYVKGVYPDGQGGTLNLAYPSSNSSYQERMAEALAHSTPYRLHDRYAFPAVGANTDSLHPVMAWWAVLFALSMLARYQPEAWADHIAVDSSQAAVPIEQLLTEALATVPELLLQTIMDVSQ